MIRLDDLLVSTGGQLTGPAASTTFDSFCYDSRLALPNQLFLAVKTDRADGHDYIADAVRAGATGVLCERAPADLPGNVSCVLVPDTRLAIQQWAKFILHERQLEIVGITGSVGKTTTKETTSAVLGVRFSVFKNRANHNGLYGLPIALGELLPEHEVAVLEMAADHPGEIARLAEIAPPHTAIVTTIEPAHLETFGSLDVVAREKGALLAALPPDGLAILNADDPRVVGMRARTAARVLWFGIGDERRPGATPDVLATGVVMLRDGVGFTLHTPNGTRRASIRLLGRHQVYAALAAFTVALSHGVDLDEAIESLAAMPPVPGRMNPLPGRRGSLLIDDTYSSSPAAAEAALETLAAVPGRRKVAVLGDMVELGDFEAAGHAQVGIVAARTVDLLVTRGARARGIAEAARGAGLPAEQIVVTYTAEDATQAVLHELAPGDVVLVKGSLATRMEQVSQALLADPSRAADVLIRQDAAWQQILLVRPDRPTWLEIDLGAIAHNVRRLKVMAGDAELMISIKADAYGHGAAQVAQTALMNGAGWFGVACFSEGLALRRAGITAPILVLGYTPPWQARDALRHDLRAAVFDLDVAEALSRAAIALDCPARVHLKVDTGMGRLGIFPHEVPEMLAAMQSMPGLVIEGIFTHLSVADGDSPWENDYTADQLAAFDRVIEQLTQACQLPPVVHASNSASLLRGFAARPAPGGATTILARPGIAVYGLDPSPQVRCPADFRPALAWKTQIAQVKTLQEGSYVGYGATYRTSGAEQIAVIPVGYADGFRRTPQHWGEVLVRGQRAPIVGRVCMDQTMINVTGIPGVRRGDEVVLIGPQSEDRITVEEVARQLGTVNYEVVSAILARVPRETVA